MQRLQPLGVVERCGKRASDVCGDAIAAESDGVGVHEMSIGQHPERGGAGAEIDHGDAELGLVGGDHRQWLQYGARRSGWRRRDDSARRRA